MMARRQPAPVDPANLPPPAVIARQIVADLARAQRAFAAVLRDLEDETSEANPPEQLALDL